MFWIINSFWNGFMSGCSVRKENKDVVSDEKHLRVHLDEKQIDKMVEDSFPASDPPSTY